MKQARIMVKGKPFFSLGGQTRNSSSYELSEMKRAWASVKALGGNTVATPVPWDAFEPEEGVFNEAFVTDLIDAARGEGLKLSILWFASWKNGTMEYSPAWVKKDTARFQRVLHKDGTAIRQLSAHCRANVEADKKTFCKLMQVIRDYDADEQTVIAVQNEPDDGSLPLTLAMPSLAVTNTNYISVQEGHFDENGEFVCDIIRSGDEACHGVWCQWDVGVIRVVLD